MTTREDRIIDKQQHMAGGKGYVCIDRLLNEQQLDNKCGLFAQVTIAAGDSLGYHEHHQETETYYIISGQGNYQDNDQVYPVKAGDVVFCKDGDGHGIENSGNEDLVFMALIIKK